MDTSPPARATKGALRRVLIVDDNRDAADSMAMLLQIAGAETRAVYDGAGALAAAVEFQPELVLLDIGLPGMDGYEVARELRRHPTLSGVTLVALTGWDLADEPERARAAGFDRHLTKPADSGALIALLGDALRPGSGAPPRNAARRG